MLGGERGTGRETKGSMREEKGREGGKGKRKTMRRLRIEERVKGEKEDMKEKGKTVEERGN